MVEYTLKILMKNTPSVTRKRSQKVTSHYVTKTKFNKSFFVAQSTEPGSLKHTCWIAPKYPGGDPKKDPVEIWCDCKFFQHALEQVLFRSGNAPLKHHDERRPVIRNPRFLHFLCKHLYAVARRLI
jgi:choline kinase